MPPLLLRDEFTGVPTRPSSGAAEFTATDAETRYFRVEHLNGTPATGDKAEYTLTFPEGTVTFRARWSSSTTLVLERVSTIPGTSNGTATLRTFTGTSTSKPNLATGSLVRMGLTVNRGAVNGQTTIAFRWHGRSSTGILEQTTDNVVFDGELTPTAGAYSLTGSLWRSIVHLEGRTPDGGGSPALAVGTYFQNMGVDHHRLHPAEFIHIVTEGVAIPGFGSFGDLVYTVEGTGASADQVARLYCTVDPDLFGTFILAARFTGTWEIEGPPLNGYMLFGFSNADGTISLWLYEWSGGFANFLDDEDVVNDGAQHYYELECAGDQVIVRRDGLEVFSLSDSTHTIGNPGWGGYRDGVPDAGWTADIFEVDAEGGALPCPAEISRHDFNTVLASLDEAALTNGVFDQHPVSAEGASADGSYARKTPLGIGAEGMSLHLGKEIVGLGDDYCVELRGVRFPTRDTGGGYTRVILWEDNFESLGGGVPLDGREGFPGGPAGTGIWERRLAGSASIDGPTCVGDGAGRVMQPAGSGSGSVFISNYRVNGITIPEDFDLEIDIYRDFDSFGMAGSILRYELGGYDDGYWWRVFNTWNGVDEGIQTNIYQAAANGQLIGGIGAPFWHQTGQTHEYEARIRNTGPGGAAWVNVYRGGVRDSADGILECSFYDGQFHNGEQVDLHGTAGIGFRGLLIDNPLRIAGFRIYGYEFTTGVPALERGIASAGVRFDEASNTGYRLDLVFAHSSGGSWTSELRLVCVDANVETRMRTYLVDAAASHDGLSNTLLSISGTILTVFHNGLQIGQFDLATDTADESGDVVPIFATGFPALAMETDNPADMEIDAWIVYGQEVPCEGPPNNPWPYPPPDPPEEPESREFPHSQGTWHAPILPSAAAYAGGYRHSDLPEGGTAIKWVSSSGLWLPVAVMPHEMPPIPTGPEPPGYDPCEILPEIPDVPATPLPDRLFFAWDFPPTQLGPLYNATPNSTGPWSVGNLAQAAARSSYLWGSQGNYNLYQSGGVYDPDLMDARILSHAGYYGTLRANPFWAGQQMMDDHAAQDRWHWPGWSYGQIVDEISRIGQLWLSIYGETLRTIIRARAAQFIGYSGPQNVKAIIAQYRFWGLGLTPEQFVDQELTLAAARGWQVFFSVNVENGGSGGRGNFVSPAQLIQCWDAFTAIPTSMILGIGLWRDSTALRSIPGMMDALVYGRAALAAMGPP